MSSSNLPQPDPTWPQSAQDAYGALLAVIQQQNALIEQLTTKITVLEERLNLSSENSDKAPSSDRNRKPSARAKKSSRRKGAQKGHRGSHRELLKPTEVHQTEISRVCLCGGHWSPIGEPERFQVTEIPEIQPLVLEYLVQRHRCNGCGKTAHPGYQPTLHYSRFGPRLHAFVSELSVTYRLSIRQIKKHLEQSFGLKLSEGAVSGILKRSSEVIEDSFNKLHEWFKRDDRCKNVDETGWKIAGIRHYMIGAINDQASIFCITPKRRIQDVEQLIGSDKEQVIVSDGAKVYGRWVNRQLCWSHVLRSLIFISEARGGKTRGKRLVKLADQLFDLNKKWCNQELTLEVYLSKSEKIKDKVQKNLKALITQPSLSPLAAPKVRYLLDHYSQLWTFRNHPEIPIHNNDQERELRNPVIKRKLSFGNDTFEGAQRYARLLSVIQSLNRQGRGWREWFVRLCQGQVDSLIPSNA